MRPIDGKYSTTQLPIFVTDVCYRCLYIYYRSASLPGDFHFRQQNRATLNIAARFNITTDTHNIA